VRVVAALGVAVAAVAFALFLLVAQLGPAPGASGAYQYAKLHATLYGKMAALSHHDVLKTTEPLTAQTASATSRVCSPKPTLRRF